MGALLTLSPWVIQRHEHHWPDPQGFRPERFLEQQKPEPFLPFGLGLPPWLGVPIYLAKIAGILSVLALLRTVFARLRMDQMINFCWRYVAPIAFLQVIIDLVIKEVF